MISTVCNEMVYPYTGLKVRDLGDGYYFIDLPDFLAKALNRVSSLYQLRLLGQFFFQKASIDSGVNFAIGINRCESLISMKHRFLLQKNDEISNFLKAQRNIHVTYSPVINCHENESFESGYATNLGLKIVQNTNTFMLLLNPGRILCHSKMLPYINKILYSNNLNCLSDDMASYRIFSSLQIRKSEHNKVISYDDVLTAIRKILPYRRCSLMILDHCELDLQWNSNQSLFTNASEIIVKYVSYGVTGFIHLDTQSLKPKNLGVGSNYVVQEMLREFRDRCRYNKFYYKIRS